MTTRKTVHGKMLYSLRHAFNEICEDIEWHENEIASIRKLKSLPDENKVISINNKDYEVSQASLSVLCDEAKKQLSENLQEKYEELESLVEFKRHRFDD